MEREQWWNDAASNWDAWGPPMRPAPEDLRIMRQFLADWHRRNPTEKARVLLCGVTPEIAAMSWPFPIDLIGMDASENMVRLVWPGDIPGVRRGLVGNWLESGLGSGSQEAVINDGGLTFFSCPDAQRTLLREIRRLLAPTGVFVCRHYAQVDVRESVDEVLRAARAGGIGNFYVFKWRLAMALQPDSTTGVCQHDIWTAWTQSGIDPHTLPQPGWSERAVGTINANKDRQEPYYFSTLKEFTALLEEQFEEIQIQFPTYELGERCPVISAGPRN
jgi:hypothetical protein